MTAEDIDSQVNGDILYSIVSGDRENQFFIEPVTGQIKVNKQLDRETVRNSNTVSMTTISPCRTPKQFLLTVPINYFIGIKLTLKLECHGIHEPQLRANILKINT